MTNREAENNNNDGKEYLQRISERYHINPSTGLYEPKNEKARFTHDDDVQGSPNGTRQLPVEGDGLEIAQGWGNIFAGYVGFAGLCVSVLGLIVSALTLVLLARTVQYARLQWEEMHLATQATTEALQETKKADRGNALDTQRSYALSRESLVSVQRALVSFVGTAQATPKIENGKIAALELSLPWINSGNTPTRNASSRVNYRVFVPKGSEKDFEFKDEPTTVLPRQFAIASHGAANATMSIPIVYFQAAQAQAGSLYIWGWITYHDVFSGTPTRLTEFCDEITGITSTTADMRDPNARLTYALNICPSHNCNDEECSDYKVMVKGR